MRIHRFITTIIFWSAAGCLLAESDNFSERDARYRLQPNDVVDVHYRYTPEFDQTVTIQPDGFVTLQIVGDMKLQGLTLEQVKAAILEKANLRLKDPEITIALKDFEKPYFMVGGEVTTPGRFDLRGSTTALQAIALAGGFKSASAKHSQVILFRRTSGDLARTQILDLKAVINGKSEEPNIELVPGDMLMVPQNKISKIERFVKWGNFGVMANPMMW